MESLKRGAEPSEMEPKRQKVAGESKVLHCRGLPTYTTETELVNMVSQYGRVVKTLILHDKNQAFIQMDSLEAAARAVYYVDVLLSFSCVGLLFFSVHVRCRFAF